MHDSTFIGLDVHKATMAAPYQFFIRPKAFAKEMLIVSGWRFTFVPGGMQGRIPCCLSSSRSQSGPYASPLRLGPMALEWQLAQEALRPRKVPEHNKSTMTVAHLSWEEKEVQWPPAPIADHMQLGSQTVFRAPALSRSKAGRRAVCLQERAVDHQGVFLGTSCVSYWKILAKTPKRDQGTKRS